MNELVEIVEKSFNQVKSEASSTFNGYVDEYNSVKMPENINQYVPIIKQLGFILKDVESCSVSFDYSIIDKLKAKYKESQMSDWLKRGEELETQLAEKMEEIESSTKKMVEENNKLVSEEFEKGNEVYVKLEEKRQQILQYQDEIVSLCADYGITSSDIAIDNNSFPIEEWNGIYDNSINYLKNHSVGVNPITKFKELVSDKAAQTVVVVILFVLCLTEILNVIAVFFFILVVYSEVTAKNRMEKFAVMLGLLYNVTPLDMGYVDKIDESKLQNEEEAIDDNPETDALIAWYEEETAKYEAENPEVRIEQEMDQLTSELSNLTLSCEQFIKDFNTSKDAKCDEIKQKINELELKFEEEKKNVKLLGDYRSVHLTYEPKYMLGLKDGILPEYVDTGLRNIVFKPCKDELLMKKFIQCMVISAYCNVKLPSISITVCDPNNFGRDLIGIYNENMDRVFKVSTDKMEKVIESFADQAQKNMKILRGKDIQKYNAECEETGKTAIEYNLIIVLSQANEKEGDSSAEALDAFMRYSADCGIFVWVVSNKTYNNTFVFNKPFEGVAHPYDIDEINDIIKFGDKFGKEVDKSRPPGLPLKDYVAKTFKEEDLWSVTTREFVWIEPGFVDGDPSRPDHYTLGNSGDVHGVIAGTSGAGKSVCINELITMMTLRHSPKELRLWLVDFKGSEFSLYLKSKRFPYQLPHLDACLCTSDPDYSRSLFTAIREESERRYNRLKQMKFRNIVEHNDEMRKQGREDEIIPRIIFLVDEFQVIYTKADTKTIESVNTDITILSKVARAAGVHVIFCSQSMKGTISSDILNMFTLRICLRCEPEVSLQILGTPYAGNIRQKFGTLYVRSVDDAKPELQKRFKTPFQKDNAEVEEHIKRMALEAEKRGFVNGNVIEYDENTKHKIDEIDSVYKDSLYGLMEKGTAPKSGAVVLGRRMSYSDNKAPENFILTTESNSNVFSAFQDTTDLINFFFTLKRNFDMYQGKYQVIYNAQTDDLHYLCHLDEIVPNELQTLSTKKTSMKDMIQMYKQIVDRRMETKEKDFPIIFVCLGWANAVGFGIDADFRAVIEPLCTLLQTAGEFNIHWVFINNSKNAVPNSIIKACEYKICGKVDEQTSLALADTVQASRPMDGMKNGYAFFFRKNILSKFKIYQSEITREVKQSEIVI